MPRYLTEADVTALLRMPDALAAVEEAFRQQASGDAVNHPRARTRLGGASLQVMSGGLRRSGVLGLKAYTATRGGARFLVHLYDDRGTLLALIEADRLGQMRTGAASGVATRHLARPDARAVGIIGTGWQARSQLAAVCAVRPITTVRAYGRDPDRRAAFAREMRDALGVEVAPVATAAEAVRGADVVVAITSSRTPVLLGEWLAPGTHVNAAGGNALDRQELDVEAVRRADLVVVDDLAQARLEAGDLAAAAEAGAFEWDRAVELGRVVAGHARRPHERAITLFESQGIAIEDVAAAKVVYERAVAAGVGVDLDMWSDEAT